MTTSPLRQLDGTWRIVSRDIAGDRPGSFRDSYLFAREVNGVPETYLIPVEMFWGRGPRVGSVSVVLRA